MNKKYTSTHIDTISALSLNYYKFGSKFDTTEFTMKINVDRISNTLDGTRATIAL
jgi:hypothetical protein